MESVFNMELPPKPEELREGQIWLDIQCPEEYEIYEIKDDIVVVVISGGKNKLCKMFPMKLKEAENHFIKSQFYRLKLGTDCS